MDEYLSRLSDLILSEMELKCCTIREMAIMCDVSEREISAIKNRNKHDIKLSTIEKICENTNITYEDIFNIKDIEIFEKMIGGLYLTDGKNKYFLKSKKNVS